jgi:hypothetical protein
MKNDDLDKFISRSLEKLELEIPPEVQENVRQRVASLTDPPQQSSWKWVKIWAPLLAAAMVVLIVSLPLLFPPMRAIKKISQIRTEFSIPEKNIKIIWVQRDDFHLREKNG